MKYKTPSNKKEFFSIVENNWKDIFMFLSIYLKTFGKQWIDGTDLNCLLSDHLEELKNSKNPKLVRAMSAALWNCPTENSGEWKHSGFDIINNLCLDEWCLHEEREDV